MEHTALTVDKLDLPYLSTDDPSFAEDPFPFFEQARQHHPWLAMSPVGLVITEYQAAKDLLRMDDRMCPSFHEIVEMLGGEGTEWGRFQHVQLLNLSANAHKRVRDIVAPMFTPAAANRNRQLMRETMESLLNEWAPKGEFDFEEFASYFPISVMSKLIGASTDAIPELRSSLEALGLAFGMNIEHMPKVFEGHEVMDAYVQQLVADRRAGKRLSDDPDLLDMLLAPTENGLSDREIYDLLIFAYVGGYDTSKNVMTFIMNTLLEHPDLYERCGEDLDYCRKLVKEALRFHSPATINRKVGAEDLEYRDVILPGNTVLFFPVSVLGRDPATFVRPDEFDPERENKDGHLAFGRGEHICLGQFIARAQIEEGLHLIAQRIKRPKPAGTPGRRPFFSWGLVGLPISFQDQQSPTPERAA